MSTYSTIAEQKQQLEDLLNQLLPLTNHDEAIRRAHTCFTEGFENLVYASRGIIENEGTHFECVECGRSFPLHHGEYGCPGGHQTPADLISK